MLSVQFLRALAAILPSVPNASTPQVNFNRFVGRDTSADRRPMTTPTRVLVIRLTEYNAIFPLPWRWLYQMTNGVLAECIVCGDVLDPGMHVPEATVCYLCAADDDPDGCHDTLESHNASVAKGAWDAS